MNSTMSTVGLLARILYLALFNNTFSIVSRETWGAKEPVLVQQVIIGPVPYVVIHHSYIPAACNTSDECITAMQWMQSFHQIDRGWNDIGYSFGVGGDGRVYTGRGFNVVGAHAPRYNDKSIGICLIGDWRTELPPQKMLDAVKNLIALGIENGHIEKNYTLIGHRQVRNTECPGTRLFEEISKWKHFSLDVE